VDVEVVEVVLTGGGTLCLPVPVLPVLTDPPPVLPVPGAGVPPVVGGTVGGTYGGVEGVPVVGGTYEGGLFPGATGPDPVLMVTNATQTGCPERADINVTWMGSVPTTRMLGVST